MAKESQSTAPEGSMLQNEFAEQKKAQFIELVRCLSRLRDVQYASNDVESIVKQAEKVVARNLPTNLLRASAIFVDYIYGFPANRDSFFPPKWTNSRELLPEEQRGSLVCTGFKEIAELEENDVVVLNADIPMHGLHAGMAGIVRQLPEDDLHRGCSVEFGEPSESTTFEIEVPLSLLRRPRPGDLIENYCL